MATLAEIVTRVQRRVIDLPSAVQAEVQTLVLEAHRELQEFHNFKVMEGLATQVTTANSATLGSIDLGRFKDYRGSPWHTDDFGVTNFLTVTHSEEDVRRAFNIDEDRDVGMPRVLLHRQPAAVGDAYSLHEWRVYPVPDGLAQTSDGEYTIRIPYWSYLAEPTTSDWFTDNAEEYIVAKATAEAFLLNWDDQRYAIWLQKAGTMQQGPTGLLRRIINRDKQFRLSNVDVLVPYSGPNAAKVRF